MLNIRGGLNRGVLSIDPISEVVSMEGLPSIGPKSEVVLRDFTA
jgi:hypothetical protein